MGMLDAHALRAARVVVDIGVHCGLAAPREVGGGTWDADKAWAFLRGTPALPTRPCGSSSSATWAGRGRRSRTRSASGRGSTCGTRCERARGTPSTCGPSTAARSTGFGGPGRPALRPVVGMSESSVHRPAPCWSWRRRRRPGWPPCGPRGSTRWSGSPASTRTRWWPGTASPPPRTWRCVLARAKAEDVAGGVDEAGRGRSAATRCSSSTARCTASRPTRRPRERWRRMRGRSGVLHTGHWLIDMRADADGGSGATLGAVSSTTVHFAGIDRRRDRRLRGDRRTTRRGRGLHARRAGRGVRPRDRGRPPQRRRPLAAVAAGSAGRGGRDLAQPLAEPAGAARSDGPRSRWSPGPPPSPARRPPSPGAPAAPRSPDGHCWPWRCCCSGPPCGGHVRRDGAGGRGRRAAGGCAVLRAGSSAAAPSSPAMVAGATLGRRDRAARIGCDGERAVDRTAAVARAARAGVARSPGLSGAGRSGPRGPAFAAGRVVGRGRAARGGDRPRSRAGKGDRRPAHRGRVRAGRRGGPHPGAAGPLPGEGRRRRPCRAAPGRRPYRALAPRAVVGRQRRCAGGRRRGRRRGRRSPGRCGPRLGRARPGADAQRRRLPLLEGRRGRRAHRPAHRPRQPGGDQRGTGHRGATARSQDDGWTVGPTRSPCCSPTSTASNGSTSPSVGRRATPCSRKSAPGCRAC